jgi:CRP-like cAMP-binding protein
MTSINIFRNAADAQAVPAGHVLFREGDPGDTMFAVATGEVELTVGGDVVEEVGPGGILGELALVDHAPRSATAIARTDASVVQVDADRFGYLVHEHPTFALQVMAVMAERLRRANVSQH